MSMTTDLRPGGVYIGADGGVFRVRGVVRGTVIADEIGPKRAFSVGSAYHAGVRPHDLPLPEDDAQIEPFLNDTSVADLRAMRDHWMAVAVAAQDLAESRRAWLSRAGDWLGLVFVVVPYRVIARLRGYKGPFS